MKRLRQFFIIVTHGVLCVTRVFILACIRGWAQYKCPLLLLLLLFQGDVY